LIERWVVGIFFSKGFLDAFWRLPALLDHACWSFSHVGDNVDEPAAIARVAREVAGEVFLYIGGMNTVGYP
jgi:hypothetical protein